MRDHTVSLALEMAASNSVSSHLQSRDIVHLTWHNKPRRLLSRCSFCDLGPEPRRFLLGEFYHHQVQLS